MQQLLKGCGLAGDEMDRASCSAISSNIARGNVKLPFCECCAAQLVHFLQKSLVLLFCSGDVFGLESERP